MSHALDALSATDPATRLADWLELTALAAADRNRSIQDLIQVIRRSGTVDAVEGDDEPQEDRGSEISQAVAETAFREIEDRSLGCGGLYPFRIHEQSIQATRPTDASIYVFLLLLSNFGADAKTPRAEALALFDDLAAQAAKSYLNGESYVFAFPRRVAPTGFAEAIDDLCSELGEGQGNRRRPSTSDQKDAKLDIVSWRAFEDGRPGKVIGFGQCATGANWKEKLAELQPFAFSTLWLAENPAVLPIRMFFIPSRIPEEHWFEATVQGGILFDRCRLAHHARDVDRTVEDRVRAWNRDVLAKEVRA